MEDITLYTFISAIACPTVILRLRMCWFKNLASFFANCGAVYGVIDHHLDLFYHSVKKIHLETLNSAHY